MEATLSGGNSPISEFNKRAQHKRVVAHRIFVNRTLYLEGINFYGFDMDYTLAEYKSPEYEGMAFRLVVDRLITIGYPSELKNYEYDHTFPVRGLWFDTLFGNLLKVDSYGNILLGVHGFTFLKKKEIAEMYPNKFISYSKERVFIMNTLFNLPECYILACLTKLLDDSAEKKERTGVHFKEVFMSYRSMFQDVRDTVDWVHLQGDLKKVTVENLPKYVHKDARLPQLLERIRLSGAQTFILTNSDFSYTDKVMGYLLNDTGKNWKTYFNLIVVDARKPLWFAEGTILREIDEASGQPRIGKHMGPLSEGRVYSGGSCDVFNKLVKARGKDVLYVGDHIFGDVLKSKKVRGWRTFLVIPELVQELKVWTEKRALFARLEDLTDDLNELCRDMDSSATNKPDTTSTHQEILDVVHKMDLAYGILGSLFRSGSRMTFFASQVERFADLYASSACNLFHYPFFYNFRAPPMLMAHESTVEHQETLAAMANGQPMAAQSMHWKRDRATDKEEAFTPDYKTVSIKRTDSRAATPTRPIQIHEDDGDDDEDEDSSEDSLESSQTTPRPSTSPPSFTGKLPANFQGRAPVPVNSDGSKKGNSAECAETKKSSSGGGAGRPRRKSKPGSGGSGAPEEDDGDVGRSMVTGLASMADAGQMDAVMRISETGDDMTKPSL